MTDPAEIAAAARALVQSVGKLICHPSEAEYLIANGVPEDCIQINEPLPIVRAVLQEKL